MTPHEALEVLRRDPADAASVSNGFKALALLVRQHAELRKRSAALLNALADAMESPEMAASWAKSGDMKGYMEDLEKELEKK